MEAGAETFELHAAVGEDDITMEEWKVLNEINSSNYNSMCLDRLNLGNLRLEHRISEAAAISGEKIIIQADGYPMSGGVDDYNTTLQAVACADVINKRFNIRRKKVQKETSGKAKMINKMFYRPLDSKKVIPIVLSGGTNSQSRELAEAAWVRCNGIAIGTYARDIIENFVKDENFYDDINLIKSAYKIAKSLVVKNQQTKVL
jgi:hypothetical protein